MYRTTVFKYFREPEYSNYWKDDHRGTKVRATDLDCFQRILLLGERNFPARRKKGDVSLKMFVNR